MATTKTDPKLAITADRAKKGKDYEGLTREKLIEAYRIMYTSRKIDDREILLKRQQKIYFQMSGAGHEAIGTAGGRYHQRRRVLGGDECRRDRQAATYLLRRGQRIRDLRASGGADRRGKH